MSFGQGLSGLNAAAQNLDIIGNNIANSGTIGFKSASATFADVYANSRAGLGVQVASVNQRFTVGNITGTGNQLDMAIDGPKGLFRVQDPSGNVLYTRNGQFFADKDSYVVNAQGQRLTGYIGTGTDVGPIRVPIGNIAPSATGTINTKANFDANSKVVSEAGRPITSGQVELDDGAGNVQSYFYRLDDAGKITWYDTAATNSPEGTVPPAGTYLNDGKNVVIDGAGQLTSGEFAVTGLNNSPYLPPLAANPFDPTNPESYTHALPISVYDSLGNAHQLTQYFVKREGTTGAASSWEVYYRMDGRPVNAGPNGGTLTSGPVAMTFDANGTLTQGANISLSIANPGGMNSPADTLNMAVNYGGSTQFGGDFTPNFTQNGYPTGEYASMSVAADGTIVASYTNGQTQEVGVLALANFNNLQGLRAAGGNAWVETSESGQAIVGRPGANGLATIKGQAVEESNVDLSQELVNMIIVQRTYQANAQAIKTQDQVMQSLITMR